MPLGAYTFNFKGVKCAVSGRHNMSNPSLPRAWAGPKSFPSGLALAQALVHKG